MHLARRLVSSAALFGLAGLAACSGGGGAAGVVPAPNAAPTSGTVITTPTTPTPAATDAPIIAVPSGAPSAAPGTQTLSLRIAIPKSTAAANGASYVSPATRSVRVTQIDRSGASAGRAAQGAATPLVFPIGPGAGACADGATSFFCTIPVTVSALANFSLLIQTFASLDGTGLTPLSSVTVPVDNGHAATTPAWSPVVASLSASLSGPFAAGVASNATLAVTAKDAAGNAIPLGSAQTVDAAGSPVSIKLTDADASGTTSLGASTYTGNNVILAYNGDLPLPGNLSVTAATSGGTAPTVSSTATLAQPTASKNFTFAAGSTVTTVQNTTNMQTSGPDLWNQTPDSKNAVVNLGNGKYLLSWGNGLGDFAISTSPYFESIPAGTKTYFGYAGTQPWEANGVWFRDIFQLGDPYKPADPSKLVCFYHAEASLNTIYFHVTGSSYSQDGGQSWSKGQLILTPYSYPNGAANGSEDSADSGAAYDPVNKRWVEFYVGIDASSGGMSEAISSDPNGSPGTWKKLYNGGFSQPGLGGMQTTIAALAADYYSAADVSWNSYLNEWIMLMDGPNGSLYLSTSPDLYAWSKPALLMDRSNLGYNGVDLVAYPTLVGPNDDKITGQTSHLYFMATAPSDSRIYGRVMLERSLTFHRND